MDHTQVNTIQQLTFELKLDFAEYTLISELRIYAGPHYTIY